MLSVQYTAHFGVHPLILTGLGDPNDMMNTHNTCKVSFSFCHFEILHSHFTSIPSKVQTCFWSLWVGLHFLELYTDEIMQYFVQLLSFYTIILKFIHFVTSTNSLFLFVVKQSFVGQIPHIYFPTLLIMSIWVLQFWTLCPSFELLQIKLPWTYYVDMSLYFFLGSQGRCM